MALIHLDITIGTDPAPVYATRKGIRQLIIENPSGNSAVYVGGSTVSSSSYGESLAAGTKTSVIGPFSGDAPVNTLEVYITGTENDVIHGLLITH